MILNVEHLNGQDIRTIVLILDTLVRNTEDYNSGSLVFDAPRFQDKALFIQAKNALEKLTKVPASLLEE